jgi:hypothetical protein
VSLPQTPFRHPPLLPSLPAELSTLTLPSPRASTAHKPSTITLDRLPGTKLATNPLNRNATCPSPSASSSFPPSSLGPNNKIYAGESANANLTTNIWSADGTHPITVIRDGEVRVDRHVNRAVGLDLDLLRAVWSAKRSFC